MRNYCDDMAYRIVICLCAMLLTGCNPPRATNSGGATGQPSVERFNDSLAALAQWKYVTHDGEGNSLTEGLLTTPYPLQDGARFVGSWQAKYTGPIDQQEKIGPQINGGKLVGELTDGQLILQLNPNMNDNNVRLIGKIDGDRLTGTWEYSNFSGLANKGNFEALLSKD
jgi:hypothetical protein